MKSILMAKSRVATVTLGLLFLLVASVHAQSAPDPLPSWNDGSAKHAIIKFVTATTTAGNPAFVAPGARFATFDQDGTLWVEQPMYTQVVFALDRVRVLAAEHPAWKTTEPFKSVLADDHSAMAKLTMKDLEQILIATHTGMTTGQFTAIVKTWIATARNPRWHRHYTDMIYQPMLEVMRYLRANGYRTYIVTGGGQAFVRTYAQQTYGVPPEQVIGSALEMQFTYNAAGDRQMLEYADSGGKDALMMIVMHDDAVRECAYGPAEGLPASKIGTLPQSLYDEAKAKRWNVISMKHDWKRIFPFER